MSPKIYYEDVIEDSDGSSYSDPDVPLRVRPRTGYRRPASRSPRREDWASSRRNRSHPDEPPISREMTGVPNMTPGPRRYRVGEAPEDSKYLVRRETRSPYQPVSVHWNPKSSNDFKSPDPIPKTVSDSTSDVKLDRNGLDGILRTGEEGKDITIHLDLPASLDLSDELAHLSRLHRLGHFKAGISFFESRLAQHVDFFPVVAEYADLLFRQGAYGNASDFVHERIHDPSVTYSKDEMMLLRLQECAANVYTKGALLPALEMAKSVLRPHEDHDELEDLDLNYPVRYPSREKTEKYSETEVESALKDAPSSERMNETKFDPKNTTRVHKRSWFHSSIGMRIQMIELCLDIISRAHGLSSYLETDQYRPLLNWGVVGENLISQRYQTAISRPPFTSPGRRPRQRSPAPSLNRTQQHSDRLSIMARSSRSPPDSNSGSSTDSDSDDTDSQNSWKPDSEPKIPLLGPWYDILVKNGYHWESTRLLSYMSILIHDDYGCYPLDGSFERSFGLNALQDAFGKFCGHSIDDLKDEQIMLTCFANASILTGYLNVPSEDRVLVIQKRFHEKAKSLASQIFTTHPELVNSKPYVSWVEGEADPTPLFCNNPRRQSIQKRKAASSKSSSDPRGKVDVPPPSINTKSHDQTESSTESWERTLELLYKSALNLGDLSTRHNILQKLISLSRYGEKSFERIHELFSLCHEEMNDSIAHALCLDLEVQLLHNAQLEDGLLDLADMRKDLYLRLKDFDELFPCHFENSPYSRHRDTGITFFDIPVACSAKVKALRKLLFDMDRPVGARVSSSNAITFLINDHLPRKGLHDRYRSRCSSCEYCDHLGKDFQDYQSELNLLRRDISPPETRHRHHSRRSSRTPQVKIVNEQAGRSQTNSTPRVYQSTRPRRETLSLDKEPEISTEVGDINEMLPEKLRTIGHRDQRISRRPRPPDVSETSFATPYSSHRRPPRIRRTSPILEPPDEPPTMILKQSDRTLLVPSEACQSFEELKSHIRERYRDDKDVWPHIRDGLYEIMDHYGVPIGELNWEYMVYPGSTLRLRLVDKIVEKDAKDQEEIEPTQPPGHPEDVPHAEPDIEPPRDSKPDEDLPDNVLD